jgi:hypothetical protein
VYIGRAGGHIPQLDAAFSVVVSYDRDRSGVTGEQLTLPGGEAQCGGG